GDARDDLVLSAAEPPEHRARFFGAGGLAEGDTVEDDERVRGEDHGALGSDRDGVSFPQREPGDCFGRRLTPERLLDLTGHHLELRADLAQKLAPPGRRGCKHHPHARCGPDRGTGGGGGGRRPRSRSPCGGTWAGRTRAGG